MTRSSSSAQEPSSDPRPVETSERLVLLDALRGFALCGVCVANVVMWFSGRAYLPRSRLEAMVSASPLDAAVIAAFNFFVSGKFLTIFSFLFGLGFALQLERARERGASIVPPYARRLGVLLALGLLHLFLLWPGDILSTYALLGFGLLLLRNRPDRTLLAWASVFLFAVPLIGTVLLRLPELTLGAEAAAAMAGEAAARLTDHKLEMLRIIESGGYLDVVRASAHSFLGDYFRSAPPMTLALFGRFLLGLLAGRHRLFHQVSLPLFRRLLGWGLAVGALGSGTGLLFQQLILRKLIDPDGLPWMLVRISVVRQLGDVGLAAVYVAGFTLLFQRPGWQRLLSVFAPVGRMALTNYLLQTVIGLLLFYGYGLGLAGRLGPSACLALSLGVFGLQMGWSHLWLARFRFGPVEWAWRSLSYGKAQPMRPRPAPAPAGA